MRSLNPNAKEFVPFAVHQFQINYPSLTSSPLIQPTPQKNNNLSFITAAKKKPKPCTKPKPPIILDPSWVVLSIADTADESLENEEQEEVPGIKTEEATPIIPHYILPVSEKPSIRAIDRWKAKWIQIARTVRENLERENMMRTSAQTNNIQNDKHNSWHQILSPGDYLPHMECIPSSTSDSNKNTSLLNNNDDCRAQNHNFSFTKDEWWSAIISGKVSNVLSMVNNSSPYFDWKTCSYTLTLSEPYNNCQEIKLGPLHVAVYYNQSACVKLFLDFGLNIESRDSLKRTPLLIAAECGHYEIFQLLVENSGDITAKDKDLNGILHCACYLGQRLKTDRRPARNIEYVKIVNWITDKRKSKVMNINWKNKQRNTPLMIAIEYGGIDIVTSLLHAGADVTCINTLQEDALSLAAKRGNNKILEILLCSNHGKKNYGNLGSSNIPQRSSDKYLFPICPINVAARNGNLESIRLLVAYGISINSFNDCHFIHKGVKFYALTPLMIASIFGFSEIVEYFVSASGGNGQQLQINLTERNGLTALGCACLFGHIDCVNIIAKFYPDSLQFLHRYHDFESVPEAVVRNMSYLPKEDHPLSIHCLCQIISRGSPLSEKLIRRLTFRKDAINPLDKNLKVPCRWDLTLPSHDVVIFVSGEDALPCKTLCHSFILKAHSEVFSTMLSSTLSTKIDDFFQFQFAHISKQVFDLILLWMYSEKDVTTIDNGTISPSLLVDLMIAANEFLILRLQRICEHRLCQCMEKKLLDDDSRAQLKELSVLLNLNHLLVYFTHERVQSPLQQHIIFQELQNLSIDGKDIMYPLKPELFPHLSYHPGTRTNTGCSIQYERELVRHILTRRIQEQNLLVTMKLKFESLLSLCLRNLSEINSFNLPSFLVDIYSISASEPGSEEVLATNYWERYLDCQPSSLSQSHTLPLLTKLFQTLFSSLFELCLCLEKYLKETAGIGRHHVEFHGFHQQFDYFTSLHDFISHEMYYLMIQHVVLSYSGYESYPSLGLLARDVIIRCDSDTLQRRIPISFINSIGKLDALYRLYTQQREEWNDIIVLEDICVHDLDTLLCYVYLGYIPIQGDDRWNNIEKMTSISSYLANLLIIADEYLMDSFKHTVEQTLIRFLSPDNCATLFSIASTVNTLRLRDAAANMFLSNYHLYIQQETTNPSSISQSHHDQDNTSTRISLFFGESLAVSDFLQYVLSSLLE